MLQEARDWATIELSLKSPMLYTHQPQLVSHCNRSGPTMSHSSYLLPLFFPTPLTLQRQSDDTYPTFTSDQQQEVEQRCQACVEAYLGSVQKQDVDASDAEQRDDVSNNSDVEENHTDGTPATNDASSPPATSVTNLSTLIHATPLLNRQAHTQYLLQGFHTLPSYYQSLDASRPWIFYWIVHSLRLLDYEFEDTQEVLDGVQWLSLCQNGEGGFGGGPGQISHTAPTYAAVCAVYDLAQTLTDVEQRAKVYNMINRPAMYRWLMSLRATQSTPYRRSKQRAVGFAVHADGEVDTRGTYCAIAIASMLNIMTPQLAEGVAEYVASCQTYEGGIGGESGVEAHGGYAYCGLATMILLQQTQLLDLKSMLRWAVHRQLSIEGGFNGRTNKLVDGCYSYWVGAMLPLLQLAQTAASQQQPHKSLHPPIPTFQPLQLQKYLLLCCADPPTVQPNSRGGMRDKPGKGPDYYHTCYCLSGLSVAQHCAVEPNSSAPQLLTHEADRLHPTNVLYNVTVEAAELGLAYYQQQAAVQ